MQKNRGDTCVASCIIAEQNPAENAVAYIISTEEANIVSAHDIAKGTDMKMIVFLLPCFINTPAHNPPNKAPSNDRLATHEPCCSVMVSVGNMAEGFVTNLLVWLVVDCKDANAGDVYPLPSPTEKGPKDSAMAANIWKWFV